MTDFPSISDLIKKPGATPSGTPSTQEKFDAKMREMDIKSKEEETASRAGTLNLPYISLSAFPISAEALKVIPEADAREKKVICFYFAPDDLRIGITDLTPEIEEFAYQLGERHHAKAQIYLISEHSLEAGLKLYATLPIIKPISKDINITDEELGRFQEEIENLQALEGFFKNISITDILTLMIAAALKTNSSDIHVEAEDKGIAVRYRIDGVLHEVANLPKEQWKKFVSRIKLLAGLKINVTDKPQDGRVTLRLTSGSLDVRVSTMPTTYGESIVMRILHSGSKGVTYDNLGLRGEAYERLRREVERPNGMIITTGPTGSGKTTTLYAILRTLNKPGVKIITLEDPVEIKMEGINQSQVDPSHDYTFAKGLRSILRQDPDICMVGEIRDLETAEIAIQAALTGHLMLSTIHTNSASGAIPRFMSMGVKPFLLAPALNAIIGQRLVRRICEHCIEEETLDAEKMERVMKLLNTLPEAEKSKVDLNNLKFYKGAGCPKCSGLGYKGRIGIYEIFTMNKEIEQIILSAEVSEYTIQEIAVKNGMVTMAQDGILKALDKITSIDEVFDVADE
jgi:type II secretory ATPase GspE/PulE/Tfp pilus assembly ATPase PilB-like protein